MDEEEVVKRMALNNNKDNEETAKEGVDDGEGGQ